MRTNVAIELTDEQRSTLADLIDGKQTKRLLTRAEVGALCRLFLESLIEQADEPPTNQPGRLFIAADDDNQAPRGDLHIADPEDRQLLAGKSAGYVVGWNKVKRALAARS